MKSVTDRTPVGPWIRRFLVEYLVIERNLSKNTQSSYRDTVKILLLFLSTSIKVSIDRIAVEDLSADKVKQFLNYIEEDRHCSGATRNQRLAAIHSLAKFIGAHSPQHLAWCAEMCAISYKKTAQGTIEYLEKVEMEALLNAPDRHTKKGARDYALLLFLYNTGARAEEAVQVTISDIEFGSAASVRLLGKGRKVRSCPLWSHTLAALKPLALGLEPHDQIFRGRRGEPLTRFGILNIVKVAARRAQATIPSLQKKRISPHTIRHTCATHLLRAGVDINTIRAWLGHVSIDTTLIYAETDLEMKEKALARCQIEDGEPVKRWRQPALMEFLDSL